ncbi:mucosal pentraxin-like isoform X2 [Dendropsophus ebraccatus]
MRMIIWALFFANVPGVVGQIDMNGKAFAFYESFADYVQLIPAKTFFTEFTICVKTCKNLTQNTMEVGLGTGHDYFGVSVCPDPKKPVGSNVYIHYKGSGEAFDLAAAITWIDICVTFDFSNGKLVLLIGGNKCKSLQLGGTKQTSVRSAPVIIRRTKYGQANTNVAQITAVNMWSLALSVRDIQRFREQREGGDIINWGALVIHLTTLSL